MVPARKIKQKLGRGEMYDGGYDLIVSCRKNDLDGIAAALSENPDAISAIDPHTGETALHIVCRKGFLAATLVVLDAPGCDLEAIDRGGFDIARAAAQGGHEEIMRLVTEARFPILKEIIEP